MTAKKTGAKKAARKKAAPRKRVPASVPPIKRDEPPRIDLDAHKAARAEARGGLPLVVFEGVEYELPAELPLETIDAFGMLASQDVGGIDSVMATFFGESWLDLKPRLSWEDVQVLLENVLDFYNFDLPES